MAIKKKRRVGSRQLFLLELICDEPFIMFDELKAEMKHLKRGSEGLSITLDSMESHGWIYSRDYSYALTADGRDLLSEHHS